MCNNYAFFTGPEPVEIDDIRGMRSPKSVLKKHRPPMSSSAFSLPLVTTIGPPFGLVNPPGPAGCHYPLARRCVRLFDQIAFSWPSSKGGFLSDVGVNPTPYFQTLCFEPFLSWAAGLGKNLLFPFKITTTGILSSRNNRSGRHVAADCAGPCRL